MIGARAYVVWLTRVRAAVTGSDSDVPRRIMSRQDFPALKIESSLWQVSAGSTGTDTSDKRDSH
jgi:hypothetical protein